jgi:hypothetical protein
VCAAAVIATCAGAPAASAAESGTTLVNRAGRPLSGHWQGWVAKSLVPIVPGRIKISLRGCPAHPKAVGCIYSTRLSTVYLDRRRAVLPATLYHELGHLYDWRVLSNRDRRRFKRLIGKARQGWFTGQRPPAEQFAEAYSFCARYRRIRSIRAYATYGYDPSPREHLAACRLIAAASKPHSAPPQPPPNPPPTIADPQPPPDQPPSDPDTQPDSPPPSQPPAPGLPPLPIPGLPAGPRP